MLGFRINQATRKDALKKKNIIIRENLTFFIVKFITLTNGTIKKIFFNF